MERGGFRGDSRYKPEGHEHTYCANAINWADGTIKEPAVLPFCISYRAVNAFPKPTYQAENYETEKKLAYNHGYILHLKPLNARKPENFNYFESIWFYGVVKGLLG